MTPSSRILSTSVMRLEVTKLRLRRFPRARGLATGRHLTARFQTRFVGFGARQPLFRSKVVSCVFLSLALLIPIFIVLFHLWLITEDSVIKEDVEGILVG